MIWEDTGWLYKELQIKYSRCVELIRLQKAFESYFKDPIITGIYDDYDGRGGGDKRYIWKGGQ